MQASLCVCLQIPFLRPPVLLDWGPSDLILTSHLCSGPVSK